MQAMMTVVNLNVYFQNFRTVHETKTWRTEDRNLSWHTLHMCALSRNLIDTADTLYCTDEGVKEMCCMSLTKCLHLIGALLRLTPTLIVPVQGQLK